MRCFGTLLLFIAIYPANAFSQDEDFTSRFIRESRESFVKEQMDLAFRFLDSHRFNPQVADRQFIAEVPKFRQVVEDYRRTIGIAPVQRPLKEMDRFLGSFKTYFRQTNVEGQLPNTAEFEDYTAKELMWETLTSAELLDMKLRQAATLIHEANTSNVVNIKTIQFLRALHGETLRLQFLISKLK